MSAISETERLRMIAQDFLAANPGMQRVRVGYFSLDRSGSESISKPAIPPAKVEGKK